MIYFERISSEVAMNNIKCLILVENKGIPIICLFSCKVLNKSKNTVMFMWIHKKGGIP